MKASDTPAGTHLLVLQSVLKNLQLLLVRLPVCYVEAGSQKNVSILYILREGKEGGCEAYDDLDFLIFRAVSK